VSQEKTTYLSNASLNLPISSTYLAACPPILHNADFDVGTVLENGESGSTTTRSASQRDEITGVLQAYQLL